jgi:acetyl-CoA carboxylase biotin carboxyl carrier protein
VFYRASSPDAPALVEVGDSIEVGTEVGLIEAMKVFSPIPSEIAGVVVEIPAVNGTLVHEGDALVRVRVGEE